MQEIINCAMCGKSFVATRRNAKYCGEICLLAGRAALARKYSENAKDRKAMRKKQRQSITDIAVAARHAGMTYGQYVAKMGL